MNVLLLCSQGMSTGMLCEKITQAAKEDGKELHIWAASEIKAREHVGKADLILLGPQIRYLQLQKVTIWKLLNVPNRETSNRLKQLLNAEMKTTCMPMKHILDYFRKKPVQKVDF